MIKEIRVANKEKRIVQITTLDERWYAREVKDKETGLPKFEFVPSASWIASYCPKGIGLMKWYANLGWDEAQLVMELAGVRGSKIHQATEKIDKGIGIKLNDKFTNPQTGEDEALTTEEYGGVVTFRDWLDVVKPELIISELTAFGDGYAGTLDRIYRIKDEVKEKTMKINKGIWVVDLKTSQGIYDSHRAQLSSYSRMDIDYKSMGITDQEWADRKIAILQLGYKRNGQGYKFTEIPDKFNLFLSAKEFWAEANPDAKPKQKDYPLVLEAECRKGGKNGKAPTNKA